MCQPDQFSKRSQDLESAFHDAGQFYWGDPKLGSILKTCLMAASLCSYPVGAFDIDTEDDWTLAELMIQALGQRRLFLKCHVFLWSLLIQMTKYSVVVGRCCHADSGDQVQVLIVAEGSTSRQQERDRAQVRDELSALAKAAHTAGSILGATSVDLLDLPDNRLDSLDRLDLIKRIEQRVECHQPECVYVHHAGDVNVDHRRLHEAVVTACRPMPGHVVSGA